MAEIYPHGAVRFLGKKKVRRFNQGYVDEFLRTKHSELVSVSKLISIYKLSPYVLDISQFELRIPPAGSPMGRGKTKFRSQMLHAVILLNTVYLLGQMKSMSFRQLTIQSQDHLQSLCNDIVIHQMILDDMNRLAVEYNLKPFEIVQTIQVISKQI
jgi:hypothetical protein